MNKEPTPPASDETPCSPCLICGAPVWDYDPKYCCGGHDCGCMGQPTDPCVCSVKCSNALFDGIGRGYEERRINAGIEKYQANDKVSDGGPLTHESKQDANPPFAAPLG